MSPARAPPRASGSSPTGCAIRIPSAVPGRPRAPSRRWSAVSTRPGPTTATQPFAVTPEQDTGASGAPPPRPFQPSPTGVQEPARRRTMIGVIAVGLLLVALIIGLVLGSGGDDSSPPVDVRERGDGAQSQSSGDGGQSAPAPDTARGHLGQLGGHRRLGPEAGRFRVGARRRRPGAQRRGLRAQPGGSLRGGRPGARGRGGCARGWRRDALQLRALQPRRCLSRRRPARGRDPGARAANAVRRRTARRGPGDARRGLCRRRRDTS